MKDYGKPGKPRNTRNTRTPNQPEQFNSTEGNQGNQAMTFIGRDDSENADHDFVFFVSFCSFRHSDWQFFRTLAFSLQPFSINRRQKVLRMKRVWWNCCIEIEAAKADLWVDRAGGARHPVDMLRAKTKNESLSSENTCLFAAGRIVSFYLERPPLRAIRPGRDANSQDAVKRLPPLQFYVNQAIT